MAVRLLLSGGTALGAVQVATIERLRAAGPIDSVHGVSVGAVNAAAGFVVGRPGLLRETWMQVDGVGFFQRPQLDVWKGLANLHPLERRIEDVTRGAAYRCPVWVGVTDLDRGLYRELRIDTVDAAERARRVCASAAQPGIHQGYQLGGALCQDGGVLHVLPRPDVGDRDVIHAVWASPIDGRVEHRHPREVVEVLGRCAELAIDRNVAADRAWLQSLADRGHEVWVYHHPEPGRPFDASPETIAWRLDVAGEQVWATRRRLNAGDTA